MRLCIVAVAMRSRMFVANTGGGDFAVSQLVALHNEILLNKQDDENV